MNMLLFIVLILSCCNYIENARIQANVGPLVTATKGEIWPKPQRQEKSQNFFVLKPHLFRFEVPPGIGCPVLLDGILQRCYNLIGIAGSLERRGRRLERGKYRDHAWEKSTIFLGTLDSLKLVLVGECEEESLPSIEDDENYSVALTATQRTLSASTIWGLLRGLETFTQLFYLEDDVMLINGTIVDDYPRFPHRGLLIDTARHFQPLHIIYQMLDAMSYNKLNVFHWHITDDQSFPFKSESFPELSQEGAYHPISKVYNQEDIEKVIEYARVRGIRVVPEFDTPGHTSSWGVSHPELLTKCYKNGVPDGSLGPMDPTKATTYKLITGLFTEALGLFPDNFFHIGGDEVEFTCWQSNPDVGGFMKAHNISTYQQLEGYFIQKVVNLMKTLKHQFLVWEEVFVNGVNLPNSTLVHVWRGDGVSTMDEVTKAGKYAIFSSCWYLDHLETGGDWQKYYACDPQDFPGTIAQKKLVLGGEACMWGETVNEYNIMPRVWPRASAVAEKLWSNSNAKDLDEASHRLEEQTCRMNFRGIPAQPPNGAGVCL